MLRVLVVAFLVYAVVAVPPLLEGSDEDSSADEPEPENEQQLFDLTNDLADGLTEQDAIAILDAANATLRTVPCCARAHCPTAHHQPTTHS